MVVIHELPGMTPDVIAFGEEVVAAGYTVVMPVLFGTPGTAMSFPSLTSSLIQVCSSSEFTKLATGKTAPITRLAAQPGPQRCTPSSAGPASGRSGCASPAATRSR